MLPTEDKVFHCGDFKLLIDPKKFAVPRWYRAGLR